MSYKTFETSVVRDNQMGLTQHHFVKDHNKQTQDYIRKDDAKIIIIQTRQKFKEALMKHKGPSIIPTVFKNHSCRYEYVRCRDKALHSVRNVRNPPEMPFYLFTFADDIFFNLTCNFRQNSFRRYVNHGARTRFIFMNKESCGELAFEEMLSQQPLFYSEVEDVVNMSQYTDPEINTNTEAHNIKNCANTWQYVVDFSIILPELKVSTAWVYCTDCGELLETVLCDKTIQVVKEEILHNISQTEIETIPADSDSVRSIIRLPLRSIRVQGCSFVEGLIGVTPLTKGNPLRPSMFVRTRLFYFCNPNTKISEVVHQAKDEDVTYPEIVNFVTEKIERVIFDSS